jgi:serine-aspartate repeat-containing protein C/D/E
VVMHFGRTGDIPVVGDWDGNGVEEIGVYRAGRWFLDVNGNKEMDAHDKVFEMGGASDRPVVGDWNGDGIDEPGIYRELAPRADVHVSQ